MKTWEVPVEFKGSYIERIYVDADTKEEAIRKVEDMDHREIIGGMDSASVIDSIFDDFHESAENEDLPSMIWRDQVVEENEEDDA